MDKTKRAEQIAVQIIKYSRNELLVSLRFMDLALSKLEYKMGNVAKTATDGKYLYYNPVHVFNLYKAGNAELNHSHLHTVFHCIFYHPFVNKKIEQPIWDLACDIAVEGIISELNMKQLECSRTLIINQVLANMESKCGKLTAERLYRKLVNAHIKETEIKRLQKIFGFDNHDIWYVDEDEATESQSNTNSNNKDDNSGGKKEQAVEQAVVEGAESGDGESEGNVQTAESIEAEWQSISERVKVDLETSSKEWGDRSANLMQNITEVNRETYDYSEFLQKFSVMGEEMQINDDEFDYIFYTYGLQLYKNVPLVEPLEYKDVKKVKEFVIAIDTSGSVQGDLVKKFITKTYNILFRQVETRSKLFCIDRLIPFGFI